MISLANPPDERWLEFALSHPQANIFHHPAWINLLEKCYHYQAFLVTFEEEGKICSGVPMMFVKSQLTGKRLISIPFSDYCIPLSNNDFYLNCLTEKLIQLSHEFKDIPIQLRWQYPQHPMLSNNTPYVFHTLQLNPDVELVAKGFHPTHRRNIRIAQEKGIRIEMGTETKQLKEFYKLHLQTRRRQGVPIQPWNFFQLLGEELFKRDLGFVLLAYKDEQCIAGGVFLNWNKTLTYKFGASLPEYQAWRPNNLLFWSAIRWGCENGFKIFDLGRTDLENKGLIRFKKGWGTDEMQLVYTNLSNKLLSTSSKRFSHVMETVIQNSPAWVCRATGELLYKHFG
jgi:lipid II:glycine glycyltransferase (peptidoglycan interpeptide bridge formation enzyme)